MPGEVLQGSGLVWGYLVFSLIAWMMEKRIYRFSLQMTPSWQGLAAAWLRVRLPDDFAQAGEVV